ncbi:hypothetical protein CBR64_20875 [Cellulosimicrobium cellulans]|uniref:Uncharacterized protein n=1 Tax=Cellulosimicrobium cellulans TaxID=1710 RepID=A0A1Y0HPU1_CELCE|nr:hypothetical protein [Cellulosimicrobium cellulans]ARU50147.1 hypothetical protein CBR64_00070 [Cellulosimicrobium cellulans]ARU53513.1 hypothetical protein CBR64_20875 [Cellulosimicrobium cellulans]
MPASTPRGYQYAVTATDPNDIGAITQVLAEGIDADVQTVADALADLDESTMATIADLLDGDEANLTMASGWTPTDNNGHRPRVFGFGPLVVMVGAATRLTSPVGSESAICTVPAAFLPPPAPTGTIFVGSAEFTAGGGTAGSRPISLGVASGNIGLAAGYGSGTLGATSVVPLVGFWRRGLS